MDGAPVDAHDAPYRIVVDGDQKPARSVYGVMRIEVTSLPFEYGGAPAVLTQLRDITARKLAEDGVRRLNRSLRVLSSCNMTLAAFTDRDAYLPHPDHVAFCRQHLDPNLKKVCVVDFAPVPDRAEA